MRKPFWLCLVAGWAVIGFGIAGVMREASRTHPADFALWFFGSLAAHDALVAPLVFVVAFLLARSLSDRVRPYVLFGLVVSAPIVAMSLPLVIGKGGPPGNESALPRNYQLGLAVVLFAVAGATLIVFLLREQRRAPKVDNQPAPAGGTCSVGSDGDRPTAEREH